MRPNQAQKPPISVATKMSVHPVRDNTTETTGVPTSPLFAVIRAGWRAKEGRSRVIGSWSIGRVQVAPREIQIRMSCRES